MKQQANQQCVEHDFHVDDMMFLQMQPYQNQSINIKGTKNLDLMFYKPYKVLQCIRPTTYKIELPDSSKIHPVFHVSYLKKVVGSQVKVQKQLPNLEEDGSIVVVQEAILDQHSC